MSLRKWNPLDDLDEIQKDMSRFFRRAVGFGGEAIGSIGETSRWVPAIDMYAKDGDLIIKAELPGVMPTDIDVSVKDDILSIRGERKTKEEIKEKNVYRVESNYGKFQRLVTLPKDIKPEEIKASYSDGILSVEVPKAATSREEEKKIKVEVEQ